jgi:hypothetical protein
MLPGRGGVLLLLLLLLLPLYLLDIGTKHHGYARGSSEEEEPLPAA